MSVLHAYLLVTEDSGALRLHHGGCERLRAEGGVGGRHGHGLGEAAMRSHGPVLASVLQSRRVHDHDLPLNVHFSVK